MPDSLPLAVEKVKPLEPANTGMMDHDVAAPDAVVILGVLSAMATPFVATTSVTVYELMTGTAGLFTSIVIVYPALSPPELLALIVYLVKARTGEEMRGMCVCVCVCVCVCQ